MNKKHLVLSVLSLSLLQACGGGGDGDVAPSPTPSATTPGDPPGASVYVNTGSVSANFERGAAARYVQLSIGAQIFGRLTASEQASSGAMVRLNDSTLTGSSGTREIRGDADFALGRWVAGTVTTKSGAETLTSSDDRAYHYVAFNGLDALPTSGSATCDMGVFTVPTNTSGTGTTASRSVGVAPTTITFGSDGATVAGEVKVSVDGASTAVSLNAKVASPTSMAVTGQFLSSAPGAGVQLGKHGKSGYSLAVGYIAEPSAGKRYMGVALLRCK